MKMEVWRSVRERKFERRGKLWIAKVKRRREKKEFCQIYEKEANIMRHLEERAF